MAGPASSGSNLILGEAKPSDLSNTVHTRIKTGGGAEGSNMSTLLQTERAEPTKDGEAVPSAPAAADDDAPSESPTKKAKISNADHLTGSGLGHDDSASAEATHAKRHIPTPHKNAGEKSNEPHMSKAREVAENRMFHDETNTVALGAAPAVPALPKDGTAFEKVGRARNAQSSIFGADEGAPAKTGAAAPAAGDAAGAAVVAGGDAYGKRVVPGGSRGENMANVLSWS